MTDGNAGTLILGGASSDPRPRIVGSHSAQSIELRPFGTGGAGLVYVNGNFGSTKTVPANSPGYIVRKLEIFDGSGNSLGFIPIYNVIA